MLCYSSFTSSQSPPSSLNDDLTLRRSVFVRRLTPLASHFNTINMTETQYQKESLGQKLKHMLPGHKDEPTHGDRTDPTVAHEQVKDARAEHERMEAEAERNIGE